MVSRLRSRGLQSRDLGDVCGMEADNVYPMRCGNLASQHTGSHSVRSARTLRNSRARPVSVVPAIFNPGGSERWWGQSNTRTRSASSVLSSSRDALRCRDRRGDTVFATYISNEQLLHNQATSSPSSSNVACHETIHTYGLRHTALRGRRLSTAALNTRCPCCQANINIVCTALHCGMVSAWVVAMPWMPPCR